ncbi:MAG: phage protein Gp36 family protein [Bilophila wadsworthia]
MAYATLDQLVSLFGADEIRTLSDRQGTGELDEAVISDALERASSEVDSYLADRYATPLSDSDPIPPVVVCQPYRPVSAHRGDIRDTDPIRERYTWRLIGCATSRTAGGYSRPAACGNGNAGAVLPNRAPARGMG